MNSVVISGVPSLMLLPPRRYKWSFVSGPHVIDLPFSVINSTKNVKEIITLAATGVAEDISTHISFSSVLKALFSERLYPDLKDDQVFSVGDVLVNNEDGLISIIGNVIERVKD